MRSFSVQRTTDTPTLVAKRRTLLEEISHNRVMFLMILPTLAIVFVFRYLPMVGIYFAFTNYNFIDGLLRSPFVGLRNFGFLFRSGTIWRLTRNTVLYNLAFIVVTNFVQIFAAILISQMSGRLFKRVSQSLMFLPYFVSFVLVGTMAYNILNFDYGSLNTFLVSIGVERIDFYSTPGYWPFIMVSLYVWKQLGYGMVIYLASIMSIDRAMYESADIDGATIFQQILHITIPHLKAPFIILVMFALGRIMRGQFELFYQVIGNNGLLFNITDILDTYVYRSLTVNFDVGMGTAAGLYQSVFGLAVVLAANTMIRRTSPDYALF
jgi:putative aldouronate transport system permease protein